MKKAVLSAVCVLLMLSVITTVSSGAGDLIKIDGADPQNEWPKAMEENREAFTETSNYSGDVYTVRNVIVSVIPDTGNNTVYYKVTASFKEKDVENKTGILMKFDGNEIKYTRGSDNYEEGLETELLENDSYTVSGAMTYNEESKDLMFEANVINKYGFKENISCTFQIIDTGGKASPVVNKGYFTNPDYTTTVTTQEPTTTEKTTKEKTTKEKTTKEKTTKETTTKTTTEKTTRKKTTKATTQTTKRRTQSKTRAPYSRRTAPARTKAQTPVRTTVRQTAASSKAGKTRKTTKARTTARKNETREYVPYSYEYEETVTDEATSSVTADTDSVFQEKGLSKSVKYKAATGIAAAVLFGVIGISAVRSRNGQTEEKKDGENKEE